jgi:hypothetical protein
LWHSFSVFVIVYNIELIFSHENLEVVKELS